MSSTRSFWKPQPPATELVKGNDAQTEAEMQAVTGATVREKNPSDSVVSGITMKNKKPVSPGAVSTEKMPAELAIEHPIIQADIIRINENFKKRKMVVSKQIEVASDSVRLSFYDNAEVDGDSISVFLNGTLVVAHQALTERAFNVYIRLDSSLETNEVSMFAENLGKYPPNTALMVISDGDKRYETYLSSDFKVTPQSA